MFASNLFRDEAELRQFCDDVQQDLREGRVPDAVERVAFALGVLEEFGHPIVDLCRAYPAERIRIHGWEDIAARLEALDKPDQPITAVSIDLSCHGDAFEDDDDSIAPYLETNFFADNAFPFSTSDRAALCAGYSGSASDWQGNFQDIDATITISGIGKLSLAIDELERQHRFQASGDPVGSDAAVVAMTYRAVAVHQAINAMVDEYGLPRPLTIIVGSNESYPFFDAPVISFTECLALSPDVAELPPAEDIEVEMPFAVEPSGPVTPTHEMPEPAAEAHVSGTEIRRRFAEAPVDVEEKPIPASFFNRLFNRGSNREAR